MSEKQKARARVNKLVQAKKIPHPNELPCTDCGHVWAPGERRHEYDHHHGYARKYFLSVQSVCTLCHSKRDCSKTNQTHCVHGHAFNAENTGRKCNGTRFCRACRRDFERKRTATTRTAEFWRNYRLQRKAA